MAMNLGPWGVQFPVRYFPNGDTTSEAFGKHIQELERIYGILNSIDNSATSSQDISDALTVHVNSTNPHPNLALATLKGNLDFSRITGNVPAARVTGVLTNATIASSNVTGNFDASRINNLTSLIQNNVVTSSALRKNGYVKFSNGLMIQWGETEKQNDTDNKEYYHTFSTPFPKACWSVVAVFGATWRNADVHVQVKRDKIEKAGFGYYFDGSGFWDEIERSGTAFFVAFGN